MHSPDRNALVVIATWNNPLDRVEFLNLGTLDLSHTHRILFSWNLKFNHNSISRGFCLLWSFSTKKHEIESIPLLLVHATHSKPNNLEHPFLFPNTYIVHHTFFLYYNCCVLLFLLEILDNILNLKLFPLKKIKELRKSLCFLKCYIFFFVRYKCIFLWLTK